MRFNLTIFVLALASGASGVTINQKGFTVDETEPRVIVTEVGRPYGLNDLTIRRFDASPNGNPRSFIFDKNALMYTIGAGRDSVVAETNVVATLVRVGDQWVNNSKRSESKAVRITSITVRGSVPEVTVDVDPSVGSTVTILGKETLGDKEWVTPTTRSRFFKAVQL